MWFLPWPPPGDLPSSCPVAPPVMSSLMSSLMSWQVSAFCRSWAHAGSGLAGAEVGLFLLSFSNNWKGPVNAKLNLVQILFGSSKMLYFRGKDLVPLAQLSLWLCCLSPLSCTGFVHLSHVMKAWERWTFSIKTLLWPDISNQFSFTPNILEATGRGLSVSNHTPHPIYFSSYLSIYF